MRIAEYTEKVVVDPVNVLIKLMKLRHNLVNSGPIESISVIFERIN